jgi:HPt (histidine-containing phosphotransfer) domain-containing protein
MNIQPATTAAVETDTPIKSTLSDHPGMMGLIEGFIDSLPGEVRKMIDCLEKNDLALLRRVVHRLGGTGGGFGFAALTERATSAEGSIDACGSLESIGAEIKSLISVVRRIEGYDENKLNFTA